MASEIRSKIVLFFGVIAVVIACSGTCFSQKCPPAQQSTAEAEAKRQKKQEQEEQRRAAAADRAANRDAGGDHLRDAEKTKRGDN
jgi:hypothetical protein